MSAATLDVRLAGRVGSFAIDVELAVPSSGITALFGPSGSGKTTVLRCIAGLSRLPGKIVLDQAVWQDDSRRIFLPPHRRALGYVFQEASLFPHLSARDNLRYGLRRAARGGGQPAIAWDEAVELLGLGRLLDRNPATLSGGERQRVAIGRALLAQPSLLLMDEPLSGLDRLARNEILPYLDRLHRALAIPVLYVSHDIDEVARLAARMIVLGGGRKVAEGATSEVMERLDFGGSGEHGEASVLLAARVTAHDEALRMTRLVTAGQQISIPLAAELAPGDEVRLRVLARDVSLALAQPQQISIRNILAGTVDEIVADPESAHAEVRIDIGGARLRARVTREALLDLDLRPGLKLFALVKSVAINRRGAT